MRSKHDFVNMRGICGYKDENNGTFDPMNIQHSMNHDDICRARLEALRCEHRDLDEAIAALHGQQVPPSLALQRLKKQKLSLKDRIARLEDELTPDIIA